MADNTQLDVGTLGDIVATAAIDFSGDTGVKFQIGVGTILVGSEGSWVQTLIVGGAGVVTGGVQRVTLASDDPAVALLTTIDVDTSRIPVLGTAAMAAAAPVTIATDDTQFGAVGAASDVDGNVHGQLRYIGAALAGTLTVGSHAVTNAGTFVVQENGAALTSLQLIDDAIYVDDADWTDDTSKHMLVGGVYQSVQHTVTDGDVSPLAVDVNGNIKVSGSHLEDVAHASGDPGVMPLAVRQDVLGALVDTDGDYSPLSVNDEGGLYVHIATSTPTQVYGPNEGAVAGGPVLVGGRYDSSPRTLTDGQHGAIAVTTAGVVMATADITSVVPGTGATNLGKAIDSIVGATDTGIALLGKHAGDSVHLTTDDGDYDVLRVSDYGALNTAPEQHHTFNAMNSASGWTALNTDTITIATTKKHLLGTDALSFEKTDTGADSLLAMIQNTISAVDLGSISPHDLIQTACYLPSLTNVAYIFVRIGTSISHYNEWRVDVADLTEATFEILALSVGDANYAGITGDGWNPSAITWIAVGVAFDAETNTMAGIVFDELSFHTNQHTSATLNSEVSSSVSSSNINVQKVGNKVVNTQGGNIGTGTQRMTIATDDVNLAAVKTAVEIIDNTVAVLGTATYAEATTSGNVAGAVRNDDKATLGDTDNEIVPLQVDNEGALYVNQSAAELKSDSGLAAGGAPGADVMIAAVGGKKLLIVALSLTAKSTTTNSVYIDNVDNDLWGDVTDAIPLSVDADGDTIAGIVLPYNPAGWFKTDAVNEAVTLNSSAAQKIAWSISWIETD